jgi:hypothetical protein
LVKSKQTQTRLLKNHKEHAYLLVQGVATRDFVFMLALTFKDGQKSKVGLSLAMSGQAIYTVWATCSGFDLLI